MNLFMRTLIGCAVLLAGGLLRAFPIPGTAEALQPVIVIPANAPESTRLAAREMNESVAKVTGKTLRTVEGASDARNQIVIGTLDSVKEIPADIRKKLEQAKAPEAFFLSARGNRIYIIGKKQVGELFGTYTFLEDKLGIRWLKAAEADDDGEYVPKRKEISVADFNSYQEPYFQYRKLDQCGSFGNVLPEKGKIWAARNKYQVTGAYGIGNRFNPKFKAFYDARTPDHVPSDGGHTTFHSAVPAELFKTHPEYFSMIDGKRVLIAPNGCRQYCITNPDVQKLVLEYVDKQFARYGKDRVAFLFGMTDSSTGWCECSECRKLDNGEYDNLDVSTRFHKVTAKLAQEVYKKYPDARLKTWAYHTYREIPKGVTPDPRMEVVYCIHGRCYGHTLADPACARNVKQLKLLKDWAKISHAIQTYEYTTATPPLYVPLEKRQAEDLKLYKTLGLNGWKEEAAFADSRFYPPKQGYDERQDIFPSNWQWLYVTGKLLWNPDLNVDDLIQEAESKYYGKAYPAMKKYHDYRRKLWENTPNCMGYPTDDQRRPNLLNPPESRKILTGYLDEALRLAGDDRQLRVRIGKDRNYLERYWMRANDKMKEKFGNTFSAPRAESPVVIDGNRNDKAWVGAYYTDAFKETFTEKKAPIPEALKTTVGILSDDKHLYFLITALEPNAANMKMRAQKDGAVWSDDSMEIFIAPPNAAGNYYHVIVNPNGVVYDALCPGNNKELDLGVTAKGRILPGRYVLEVKIPVSKMGASFERGGLWRIHFTRNRSAEDSFARQFSIDAETNHNMTGYRAMEIGTPYLKNGSLDDVKDGKTLNWSLQNAEPFRLQNGFAVHLKKGRMFQLLTDRELWQSPAPRKVSVSFKAWGKGKIHVYFYRYSDKNDPKAKHGYTRKFLASDSAGVMELDSKPQVFSAEYTIKPGEWATLAFHADHDAWVDDVSLKLVK